MPELQAIRQLVAKRRAMQATFDRIGKSGAFSGEQARLTGHLEALLAHIDNLELVLRGAHRQLAAYWEMTGSCPCGARLKSLQTHPHVIGCPVAVAARPDSPSVNE